MSLPQASMKGAEQDGERALPLSLGLLLPVLSGLALLQSEELLGLFLGNPSRRQHRAGKPQGLSLGAIGFEVDLVAVGETLAPVPQEGAGFFVGGHRFFAARA